LLFLALFIYPLTVRYGITGTALAVLGSSVIVQVPTIWYLAKVLECKIRQLLRPIWAPLVGAGSMLIVVYAVRTFVFSQSSGAVLICLVLMALLIYFISSWLMDRFGEKRLILLWREQIMLFWNVSSKDV
jgi:PST family polysaccharide transporter/lipopolysaccharide exporter